MGDSDDDAGHRRRDKFAKEREDYDRKDNRTGNHPAKEHRSPNRYGNSSPPAKRHRPNPDTVQPPMMTFKQFLSNQDDEISDEDAVKKYNSYKTDFQKEQISKFFKDHKEEDWFRSKYHPDICGELKAQATQAVKKRLAVFLDLYESGWLDELICDVESQPQILKFLDAVVIKLEGGSSKDLEVLNLPDQQPQPASTSAQQQQSQTQETEPQASKEPSVSNGNQKSLTPTKKRKRPSGSDDVSEDGSISSDSDMGPDEPAPPGEPEAPGTEVSTAASQDSEMATVDSQVYAESSANDAKSRLLHKTKSILLKNLDASVSLKEVEELCENFEGFIRVMLQDPQPERGWSRRAWLTFRPDVNVKEICWTLTNTKFKGCELNAMVNRDLRQRVRPVTGPLQHKRIVRADIKHAANIIGLLDQKWALWTKADVSTEDMESGATPAITNPVLENITEYLVEEGSCEEEELLGQGEEGEEKSRDQFEMDEELTKVLDRLLLYLRVVHSIDYYTGMEYSSEDLMPHRCGLLHVRAAYGKDKVKLPQVEEYLEEFEKKISHLLTKQGELTLKALVKLGRKDSEEEVERFIRENTQELAKDKWLCPLSGKKFKGPDFVRKHILNKHTEKLEEVKKEVVFFNNYLRDPKRPMLPARSARSDSGRAGADRFPDGQYRGGPPPPRHHSQPYRQGNYGGGYSQHSGGYAGYRAPPPQQSYNRGGRNDPRQLIQYGDAPGPDMC